MHDQARDERRWLKRFGRSETAGTPVLCFHYAGGNASMFRDWSRLVPPFIDLIGVQLPGRTDRFSEPPYEDMVPLVDKLIEVIKPFLDQPFACYGASMGARVAWALTHALRERAMPMPCKLFVASSPAPSVDHKVRGWNEPDDGLIAYMREMGGTPPEILGDPDLLRGLLPTLRADLTVLAGHNAYRPSVPLDVAIQAFAGADDVEASPGRMGPWGLETSARFDLDVIAGGHFFDRDGQRHVIEAIGHGLS